MAKQTLLEKALSLHQQSRPSSNITQDQMEAAVAWLEGVVTLAQLTEAFGFDRNSTNKMYIRLVLWLREAYRNGMIKVVVK